MYDDSESLELFAAWLAYLTTQKKIYQDRLAQNRAPQQPLLETEPTPVAPMAAPAADDTTWMAELAEAKTTPMAPVPAPVADDPIWYEADESDPLDKRGLVF